MINEEYGTGYVPSAKEWAEVISRLDELEHRLWVLDGGGES